MTKINFNSDDYPDIPKSRRWYEKAINDQPPSGFGLGAHQGMYKIARQGILAGVPTDEILADIKDAWCGDRPFSLEQAKDAHANATRHLTGEIVTAADGTTTRASKPKRKTVPVATPMKTLELVRAGWGATRQTLRDRSPVPIPTEPTEQFKLVMRSLFSPNDKLLLGANTQTQLTNAAMAIELATGSGFVPWPQITLNPFSGELTIREGKRPSLRCEDTLTRFTLMVVEFDSVPPEIQTDEQRPIYLNYLTAVQAERAAAKAEGRRVTPMPAPKELAMPEEWQLAFWSKMVEAFPVVALLSSGGKSIHAWIAIGNVASLQQWRAEVRDGLYAAVFTPLGADPSCANAGRQTRAVGHHRSDGGLQELIYLNPSVLGTHFAEEWNELDRLMIDP